MFLIPDPRRFGITVGGRRRPFSYTGLQLRIPGFLSAAYVELRSVGSYSGSLLSK
jgi:hypothetical protein